MEIKNAELKDTSKIINIVSQAKEFFKKYDIRQWEEDYPSEGCINEHIKNGEAHIAIEGENIAGFLIVSFDKSPENAEDYFAVLHLLAVDNSFKSKGIATEMMFFLNRLCRQNEVYSIRTSVHNENIAMRRALKKSGFLTKEHQLLSGGDFLQYEKKLKA